MNMKAAIYSLAAAILVGCATPVPMDTPANDQAGKRFEAPPPGRAIIYIYRESGYGAPYLLTAWLGSRALGQLGADTWFRLDVEPGAQSLRCTTAEASQLLQLNVTAGEVRFVEIAVRTGWSTARCAIFEVAADQGRKAVSAGNAALAQ